jgi:hypothetical protein
VTALPNDRPEPGQLAISWKARRPDLHSRELISTALKILGATSVVATGAPGILEAAAPLFMPGRRGAERVCLTLL